MKLSNLHESRGEEVEAFSTIVGDIDPLSEKNMQLIQTVGAKLFKAGFSFDASSAKDTGELTFSITTDDGLKIEATIAYRMQHKWCLHILADESNKKLEWDSMEIESAAKMEMSKMISTIDAVYASVDAADLMFGCKHRTVK